MSELTETAVHVIKLDLEVLIERIIFGTQYGADKVLAMYIMMDPGEFSSIPNMLNKTSSLSRNILTILTATTMR